MSSHEYSLRNKSGVDYVKLANGDDGGEMSGEEYDVQTAESGENAVDGMAGDLGNPPGDGETQPQHDDDNGLVGEILNCDDTGFPTEEELDALLELERRKTAKLQQQVAFGLKWREIEAAKRHNEQLQEQLKAIATAHISAERSQPEAAAAQHQHAELTQPLSAPERDPSARGKKAGRALSSARARGVAPTAAIPSTSTQVTADNFRSNEALQAGADNILRQLGVSRGGRVLDSSDSEGLNEAEYIRNSREYAKRPSRHRVKQDKIPTKSSLKCDNVHFPLTFSESFGASKLGSNFLKEKMGVSYSDDFDNYSTHNDSKHVRRGDESGECRSKIKWPNECLGARYNNYGKSDVKYRSLDLRLLVAGELNVISECVDDSERDARTQLLGDIVFNSAHYQWPALLKFHAAVLMEIQHGRMEWGDSYSRLEQQLLMPYPLSKVKPERKGLGKTREGGRKAFEGRAVYCSNYQSNNCRHNETHQGQFFNEVTTLHHICATCLKHDEKKSHPASSPDCPYHEA